MNDIVTMMINIVALTIIIKAIEVSLNQQAGEIPDFDDYHCDGDNHLKREVNSLSNDVYELRVGGNSLRRVEH
jgi:hypothetical protein